MKEHEYESNANVTLQAVKAMNEALRKVEDISGYRFWCHKSHIPKGSQPVEAFLTNKNILIVLGEPDESHSCDEMGCSSMDHVIARFDMAKSEKITPQDHKIAKLDEFYHKAIGLVNDVLEHVGAANYPERIEEAEGWLGDLEDEYYEWSTKK